MVVGFGRWILLPCNSRSSSSISSHLPEATSCPLLLVICSVGKLFLMRLRFAALTLVENAFKYLASVGNGMRVMEGHCLLGR